MSQRERHRRRRQLTGLATQTHTCVSPAGSFPLLAPLPGWEDFRAFDRRICAGGLKRFVRPAFPAESFPAVRWILVEELAPGIRRRRSFQINRHPDEKGGK